MGWEYFYEAPSTSRKRLLTFGFALSPWQNGAVYRVPPRSAASKGDPVRSDVGGSRRHPYLHSSRCAPTMRSWAARRVMAFSDDLIRAAVHTRRVQRRRRRAAPRVGLDQTPRVTPVGRTCLTAINPVVDARLDAGGTLYVRQRGGRRRIRRRGHRLSRRVARLRQHATGATTPPIARKPEARRRRCALRAICRTPRARTSKSTSAPRPPRIRRGCSPSMPSSAAQPTAGSSSASSACLTLRRQVLRPAGSRDRRDRGQGPGRAAAVADCRRPAR